MLEGVLKNKSHLLTRFDKSMMNIYMDNEFLIFEVFKEIFCTESKIAPNFFMFILTLLFKLIKYKYSGTCKC